MIEMKTILLLNLIFVYIQTSFSDVTNNRVNNEYKFTPDWNSLDSRKLPRWYDDAKFGIFIHWGVFSVPSFGSEWFWKNWKEDHSEKYVEFMKKNYKPGFSYPDFAHDFTAEFFDPSEWASIFNSSGARYVVLTSKHHEGYTLWPSKYSFGWNSADVGPHRDLVGDLAKAIRTNTSMKFGLYHSLYEWFNPLYVADKENHFSSKDFVNHKTIPELHELIELYKPEVIWSDGEWEAEDTYWESKEFLAWLFNESPVRETVVVNDRWGSNTLCEHGDFYTCQDRFSPGVLQKHKWENCLTIDRKSWGFRRNAKLSDYMSIEELITELVKTVSCGGNVLMNVGPTKDGIITPIYAERLLNIGTWLGINGEAIFETHPWIIQNDTITEGVWYTARNNTNTVYASVLNWPKNESLTLVYQETLYIEKNTVITLLGTNKNLTWKIVNDTVEIRFPEKSTVANDWAWVLKFSITELKKSTKLDESSNFI